jgi:ceramide glucosyltransferase
VNNNSALTYVPILSVAAPVSINGMCYAIKTETLSRIGGFAPLLRHLTDDLAVADAVRDRGGRLVQTPFPQEVATTIGSFKQYLSQMHRWYVFALLLMRRRPPLINALLLIFYGMPPIYLLVALTQVFLSPSPRLLCALVVTLLLRSLVLIWLQRRLTGQSRHRPVLSLVSELLQVFHLFHAVTVRTIRWRTRRYRVYDNDRFVST